MGWRRFFVFKANIPRKHFTGLVGVRRNDKAHAVTATNAVRQLRFMRENIPFDVIPRYECK